MGSERFRRRKNFLPTLVVAIFLWIVWAVIFFFVPPEGLLIPVVFLLVTFLAVFFIGALLFANTRRGLLAAIGVLIFMGLNFYGAGNYLNAVLLAGLLLAAEYYLSR